MPQTFGSAVMTDSGIALLARAQAGEILIEFTKLAVGSGTYSDDEKTVAALQAMPGLKELRNSYSVSSVSVVSESCVKTTTLITNCDPATREALVTEGFYINEMGIYARAKGGDEEVLYSIVVTSGEHGDYMPPYSEHYPVQIVQDYYLSVSNAGAAVNISVDSGAVALKADMEERLQQLADFVLATTVKYDESSETLALSFAPAVGYDESSETFTLSFGTWSGYDTGSSTIDGTNIDAETAASIVEAGTEEMTEEEVAGAYSDANSDAEASTGDE